MYLDNMCGIFGIISKEPIDRQVLERASRLMTHRGPDDFGIYLNLANPPRPTHYNIGLGHTRLSIIDLSPAGHQPMCNETRTIWVVYNGEIYNFKELREILKNRGHIFKSNTDTEVVIHAYEEWEINCLYKFNGMFSFAIWDEKEQTLFIARDRLGIKPLYYSWFNNKFIFSSEIKSILLVPGVERKIDWDGVYSVLLLLWIPGKKTMFENIYKLLPGHYIIYKRGQIIINKYWDISISEDNKPINKVAELYELLKERVQAQMISDVPIGAFLSGGLDSSAIVALISEMAEQPITTYTIAFSKRDQQFEAMPDDSRYAKLVANRFKTKHQEFIIEPDIIELLPKIIWHLDEPLADPAAINTYLICKAAKEDGTTVLLSGIGGDEIFGGYRKYLSARLANFYRLLPQELRKSIIERVLRALPIASENIGFRIVRWAKWFVKSASNSRTNSYISNSTYYNPEEINLLINHYFKIAYDQLFPVRELANYLNYIKDASYINQMCFADTKLYLPCLNLTYPDKAGMAVSVEIRPPILDHKIVEFAFNLPATCKIRNFTQKYIFKKAMKRLLPESIIKRPKTPFGAPLRSWIAKDLNPVVEDLLSERNIKRRGFLNNSFVRRLIDENRAGKEDHAHRIWALLTLEIWFRTFVDNDGSKAITLG